MSLLDTLRNGGPTETGRVFGTKEDKEGDEFYGTLVEVFTCERRYPKPGKDDMQINWKVDEGNGSLTTVFGSRGWLEAGMKRSNAKPGDTVAGRYYGVEKTAERGKNPAHMYRVAAEHKNRETSTTEAPATSAPAADKPPF